MVWHLNTYRGNLIMCATLMGAVHEIQQLVCWRCLLLEMDMILRVLKNVLAMMV